MNPTKASIKCIILLLFLFFMDDSTYAKATIERTEFIQVGIKPLFGVGLSDFFDTYPVPGGVTAYVRGIYQLNTGNGHYLYPEFKTGWMYMTHKTESNRTINFVPFHFNFFWEWGKMNFRFPWGMLKLKPFIGAGMYYILYESSRMTVAGLDGGYQVGLNLELSHMKMKNFYIEASIEHFFIAEEKQYLPGIIFTIGAGYNIPFGKPVSTIVTPDDRTELIRKYLAYLDGGEEVKIVEAAEWFGGAGVRVAVPRLILLLEDGRDPVRSVVAISLGKIGDKRGIEPLAQAILKEQNENTLYAMLLSISRMRPGAKTMKVLVNLKLRVQDPIILDYINTMEKLFK